MKIHFQRWKYWMRRNTSQCFSTDLNFLLPGKLYQTFLQAAPGVSNPVYLLFNHFWQKLVAHSVKSNNLSSLFFFYNNMCSFITICDVSFLPFPTLNSVTQRPGITELLQELNLCTHFNTSNNTWYIKGHSVNATVNTFNTTFSFTSMLLLTLLLLQQLLFGASSSLVKTMFVAMMMICQTLWLV